MESVVKNIWNVKSSEVVKIVDNKLLESIPSLKDKELIVNCVKNSGGRIFIQFRDKKLNKTGTLKVLNSFDVEVLGKEDVKTLKMIIEEFRYKSEKPTSLKMKEQRYFISNPELFWNQNSTNIHIYGLSKNGNDMYVVGSAIVEDVFGIEK